MILPFGAHKKDHIVKCEIRTSMKQVISAIQCIHCGMHSSLTTAIRDRDFRATIVAFSLTSSKFRLVFKT